MNKKAFDELVNEKFYKYYENEFEKDIRKVIESYRDEITESSMWKIIDLIRENSRQTKEE